MTTRKRTTKKESRSMMESNAAKRWWSSLSQTERDFAMNRFLAGQLEAHLREAITLAQTYLDDGASYSALRVLRDASSPDVVMRLGLGIRDPLEPTDRRKGK
jgi:hypothetical protein